MFAKIQPISTQLDQRIGEKCPNGEAAGKANTIDILHNAVYVWGKFSLIQCLTLGFTWELGSWGEELYSLPHSPSDRY
jgi:hypothetical protein